MNLSDLRVFEMTNKPGALLSEGGTYCSLCGKHKDAEVPKPIDKNRDSITIGGIELTAFRDGKSRSLYVSISSAPIGGMYLGDMEPPALIEIPLQSGVVGEMFTVVKNPTISTSSPPSPVSAPPAGV